MNNRRKLIFALGTAGSFPFAVASQQAKKIYRIGFVTGRPRLDEQAEAFRQRLRELGYVEGRNVIFDFRHARSEDRFRELAAQLVGVGVQVIFAQGPYALRAARAVTATVPIVAYDFESDPIAAVMPRA